MENFTVTTHHFNIPRASTVALSSGMIQWDSIPVDDIIKKLFEDREPTSDGTVTSTDHNESSIMAQSSGDSSIESHCPPRVLLIVGDSRDFIKVSGASSRIRSASAFTIPIVRAIYRRIATRGGRVYLKNEGLTESQPVNPDSPLLHQGGMIEISDRTSDVQLSYSLTFEFFVRQPGFPNSPVSTKIIVLNVPDYQWFRRNGTCNNTDAIRPFFSIDEIVQSQSIHVVGILGNDIYRHTEAAKFLSYFRTSDLIVERLFRYVDKIQRNLQRVSSTSSVASITSADPQDSRIEMRLSSAASTADSGEILRDEWSVSIDDEWLVSVDDEGLVSVDDERLVSVDDEGSVSVDDEGLVSVDDEGSVFVDDDVQLQFMHTLLTPDLEDISVFQLQSCLQDAGPRIQRDTYEQWDVQSDDDIRYQDKSFPYIGFVPVDIKLNGKEKLCHWGCLDENGRFMVLSSGEMQMRHMSGHGTMKPCPRIPPFINVSTRTEYEEIRPIHEAIRIYFNVTREHQSGYGRLTALRASGKAMQYLYQQIPL